MRTVSKRAEEILSSLISEFVDSGRPVGSRTLAKRLGSRLSPATIRNVMADLERSGLLAHKHTSSGRVPTDNGVRYFVDKLLEVSSLSDDEILSIKSKYDSSQYSVSDILHSTSGILSELSNYTGLVVAPKMDGVYVKHMEFIPLSNKRILGIFVGRNGLVENRIIKVDRNYNYSELEKINNYCNRAFYGLALTDARDKISKEFETVKEEYDELVSGALLLSQKMFVDLEKTDLFVDGGSQLMNILEFDDLNKAASLMDLLEEKRRLIDLLNGALESESVNIFIGLESGYGAMVNCSVVSAPYKKDGRVLGTLGIIGPTRMNYAKVIPIVDCTAKLVSDVLNGEDIYDG